MRKIKFRAYNQKTKKWVHRPGDEVNLFGETILLGGFMPVSIEDLNDCVALQFTGLNDKASKEIYEGDILQIQNETGSMNRFVIKYGVARRTQQASVTFDYYEIDIPCFYFENVLYKDKVFPIVKNWAGKHDLEMLEIIGNIVDNPELLVI